MKAITVLTTTAVLALAATATANKNTGMGCYYDKVDKKYMLEKNVPYSDKYAAWGHYNDTLNEIGWGKLHIRSHSTAKESNYGAFYCAGVVEAALTHTRISQYFKIFKNNTLTELEATGGEWPQYFLNWMQANLDYVRNSASKHGRTDAWWRSVGYILARFDGLVRGYSAEKGKEDLQISEIEMWSVQAIADLDDIYVFLKRDPATGRIVKRSPEWHDLHHHCSALVRLAENNSDVFVGHNSWTALNDLNRILKDYAFDIIDGELSAHRWTFSGYAALLVSVDDIWLMDNNLVVFETSLHTWNETLYDLYCKPESALNWVRVQVANMLASNGRAWTQHFTRENSFTYNNQYVVVDYNRFTPGSAPKPGFVWNAEQVPGHYAVGDRTAELIEKGWIPGINTPFYKEVYDASGIPEKTRECENDYWTYYNCSRYLIMQRDVPTKVKTYDEFKAFMRYNDWKNDKLSNGDAGEQIISRYDLRPEECLVIGKMKVCPSAFGGVDAKTVRYKSALKMEFDAISSPQYETQPAWELGVGKYKDLIWDGLPKTWKFPWTYFGPDVY